ncbi:hypothetical protein XENOCAPTIV_025605, partial [Xenoophorus captivus]
VKGDENIQSMLVGTLMRKIKSRNWKKQRYFKLQDDIMTIWYKSKKAGKAHSTFSVSDVEVVREGHQSEVLLSIADVFPADRCFTVVFRGRRGNLDLVAESAEEAQSWIKGLRKLIENLENMGEREKLDQATPQLFFCLHQMADKSQTGALEGDEFVLFYKMLTQREDILKIFQEFSSDGQKLSQTDLEEFLREEQLEGGDIHHCAQELIECYEPSDTGTYSGKLVCCFYLTNIELINSYCIPAKLLKAMTFDGFLMYLGSAEGSIFSPQCRGIFQDMSQPLCHYFISSSHNTYLMEDQLRGQSSVEGYIR